MLPLGTGTERKPALMDRSEFNEAFGHISPDGRWVAYSSDESGTNEIYVRPFDGSAATGSSSASKTSVTGKWMVSKDGGIGARWSHDGNELFYLSAVGGTIMAVDVSTRGVFQAGVPRPLFKVPAGVLFWDVSSDGKRFVMAAPSASEVSAGPAASSPMTVVLNWQAALKK